MHQRFSGCHWIPRKWPPTSGISWGHHTPTKRRRGSPPCPLVLDRDSQRRLSSCLLRFQSFTTYSQPATFSSYRHVGTSLVSSLTVARDPDLVVVLHRISGKGRLFLYRGHVCRPTVWILHCIANCRYIEGMAVLQHFVRLFTVHQVVPSRGVRYPKYDIYFDEVPRIEDQPIPLSFVVGTL